MKLPAIITLLCLLALTFSFMWIIHPRQSKLAPKTSVSKAIKPLSKSTTFTQAQRARIAEHVKGWDTNPSYEADFNALDPSYKVAALSNSLFDPADDYWGLPRDEKGTFELVDAYCTACHSASIVMQQRATSERWKELLIWMESKQGMAKIPEQDEDLLLEYLGRHFSTK